MPDEDTFGHDGILAAIGMKWRKHSYRLRHFFAPKLLQQFVLVALGCGTCRPISAVIFSASCDN